MTKYFSKSIKRDTLAPNVEGYQLDLKPIVDKALNDGVLEDNLPSWQKVAQDPIRAKGFLSYMVDSMFNGAHGIDSANIDLQHRDVSGRRVAMMFLPHNTRIQSMQEIFSILEKTLPTFDVIEVSGNTMTQRKAEELVRDKIETTSKDILILASQMGQRSFSIPEITELYLAYDNGAIGSTIQKMSRTLTPSGRDDKIGRIFSLSFDPNRDDKFDSMILATAIKLVEGKKEDDIESAIKKVLKSQEIFRCTEDGRVPINACEFVSECLSRDSVSRVVATTSNLSKIPSLIIKELAKGRPNISTLEKAESAVLGKTFEPVTSVPSDRDPSLKDPTVTEMQKVREMIASIIDNSDLLFDCTDASNIEDALEEIYADEEMHDDIETEFEVPFPAIKFLFDANIINKNVVDMKLMTRK